jgi:phosphopantothenate synthetase
MDTIQVAGAVIHLGPGEVLERTQEVGPFVSVHLWKRGQERTLYIRKGKVQKEFLFQTQQHKGNNCLQTCVWERRGSVMLMKYAYKDKRERSCID